MRRNPARGARVERRKMERQKGHHIPDVQGARPMTVPEHIRALAEKLRKATPSQ
jgi:hypothetical protein